MDNKSSHIPSFKFQTASGMRSGSGVEERHVQGERNPNTNEQREIQRISAMHISATGPGGGNVPNGKNLYPKILLIFLPSV